jgi:hypothetical protein
MKRLLKSWVFWAFVVPLTAAFLFAIEIRWDYSYCRCGSNMKVTSLRLGYEGVAGRMGLSQKEILSLLAREILPASHVHAWAWRHGRSQGAILGTLSCGGNAPVTGFARSYELFPEFRAWLKGEIAAGRLTASAIEAAVMSPATLDDFYFGWKTP